MSDYNQLAKDAARSLLDYELKMATNYLSIVKFIEDIQADKIDNQEMITNTLNEYVKFINDNSKLIYNYNTKLKIAQILRDLKLAAERRESLKKTRPKRDAYKFAVGSLYKTCNEEVLFSYEDYETYFTDILEYSTDTLTKADDLRDKQSKNILKKTLDFMYYHNSESVRLKDSLKVDYNYLGSFDAFKATRNELIARQNEIVLSRNMVVTMDYLYALASYNRPNKYLRKEPYLFCPPVNDINPFAKIQNQYTREEAFNYLRFSLLREFSFIGTSYAQLIARKPKS